MKIRAEGMAPNLPHAQHMHVASDEGSYVRGTCPTIEDDAGSDALVNTVEGIGKYGTVVQSLTTTGGTGNLESGDALALDRFPVADERGNLRYTRTFTPTDDQVHEQLGDVEIVIHGIDLDGDGEYAGAAGPLGAPLEATIPALCGGPPPQE